ncbi:hypothetical protein ACTQ33_15150 [Candidatus Avoscillospira sp. LCP25S3_F1]|uniref:hypothetical protein n=1 Tax=Candidatus Avoscillospira sp. LCP25S3_F1 TaxID=3438825 RepID=UPI003F912A4E
MEQEKFKNLEEFFGRKKLELPELKRTLFGGYRPSSVQQYVEQLEEQTRQQMLEFEKQHELDIQALRERCEELEQQTQEYGVCLDQISQSLTSLSQSFLQLLEQQTQRDQLLRTYQRQIGGLEEEPLPASRTGRRMEEAVPTDACAITPLFQEKRFGMTGPWNWKERKLEQDSRPKHSNDSEDSIRNNPGPDRPTGFAGG